MKILAVIPSRYASSRFPAKPLVDIAGMSMVQRVYTQAGLAKKPDKVVVATDDTRIYDHVCAFGGEAIMTSAEHNTGTDRVGEVASHLSDYDAYINIQGDEPFISPDLIDQLALCFIDGRATEVATLIKKFSPSEDIFNSSLMKVAVSKTGKALYFSRSVIPFIRDVEDTSQWPTQHTYYKHIGIYAYTSTSLNQIIRLSQSSLEKAECLEQLRWLENDIAIHVQLTSDTDSLSIDTPADLEKAIQYLENHQTNI